MSTSDHPAFLINPSGRTWTCEGKDDPAVIEFHRTLPDYAPTPLINLDSLARHFGVGHVLLKNEARRFGLPAYKILGASWGIYRALIAKLNLPAKVSLGELAIAASKANIKLYATTDGNHGRAVARMAKYLGIPANITVPRFVDAATQEMIRSEGATVKLIHADYDESINTVKEEARQDPNGLLVIDVAWPGYEDIPQLIVDGYSTMFSEIDSQAADLVARAPDLVIVPIGAGSFGQAVVTHYGRRGRSTQVLAVEAEAAACLHESLKTDESAALVPGETIMNGLCCGILSTIAWPVLQHGLVGSVTVTDIEAHDAVRLLKSLGVEVGPCGAASLAALQSVMRYPDAGSALGLGKDSVVVLLSTEGPREYVIPTA
ncbi:MAG: hypothetical protein LQ347_004686 [Umbilicaria vellea]|nr:MAG: hypothetical protein LQ347_004686 [Umbilicaria vellea]